MLHGRKLVKNVSCIKDPLSPDGEDEDDVKNDEEHEKDGGTGV